MSEANKRTRALGNRIAWAVGRYLDYQGYWVHKASQSYALIPRGHPMFWKLVKRQPGKAVPKFAFMSRREDVWGVFDIAGLKWDSGGDPDLWLVQATEASNMSHRRRKIEAAMKKAGVTRPILSQHLRIEVWGYKVLTTKQGKRAVFLVDRMTGRGWRRSWRDGKGNPTTKPERQVKRKS